MTEELNDVSREFRDRLFALLREYNVEMQIEEETHDWSTEAVGVNFFSYTEYNDAGEIVRDSVNVTLGRWEDGSES